MVMADVSSPHSPDDTVRTAIEAWLRAVSPAGGFTEDGVLGGQGRFGDERRDMVLHALLSKDLHSAWPIGYVTASSARSDSESHRLDRWPD